VDGNWPEERRPSSAVGAFVVFLLLAHKDLRLTGASGIVGETELNEKERAMTMLTVRIGPISFTARLESTRAPRTAAAFQARLPFEGELVQARWSGEAGWVPLADYDLGVAYENATSHPSPGQVLWHPPGLSEAELLVPYGSTCFSSRVGQLAGSHFLTIVDERGGLAEVGSRLLREGAQPICFQLAE
jgi:hypothetical protein